MNSEAWVEGVVGVPVSPELFDVAVSGGALRVARWPGAGPAVLAGAHPAFGPYWGPAAEAYVDYDLGGQPPELRSTVSEAAVRADAHNLFTNTGASTAAEQADCPVIFLRGTRDIFDDPPGIYPPDAVATVTARATSIEAEDVPDSNHYTILLGDRPAAVVANRIRALAT